MGINPANLISVSDFQVLKVSRFGALAMKTSMGAAQPRKRPTADGSTPLANLLSSCSKLADSTRQRAMPFRANTLQ